jgi:hypothetical protein
MNFDDTTLPTSSSDELNFNAKHDSNGFQPSASDDKSFVQPKKPESNTTEAKSIMDYMSWISSSVPYFTQSRIFHFGAFFHYIYYSLSFTFCLEKKRLQLF